MSLISKKTHCYRCAKGEMGRFELRPHPDSSKIRYVQNLCTSCGSSSKLHLKGIRVGLVELFPKYDKEGVKK